MAKPPKKGKTPAKRTAKPEDTFQPIEQGRALIVRPHGRPTVYDEYSVGIILEQLAAGVSLKRICARDDTLPAESTVRKWALEDRNGFYARYARARDIGLDSMADETLDIADDGRNDYTVDGDGNVLVDWDHIARSKVRIDTRKWYLSRLAPKRYGALLRLDEKPSEPEKLTADYVLTPDETGPDAPIL